MRLPSTPILAALACAAAAHAQSWVTYANETATRLAVASNLVVNDNLEKDFAWGDFDKDGDVDIVCMRKFPGSIQGGFRDLLMMNEGGVLVDRTVEYGSASDVAGYMGMMDPCNDRDVDAVDVNGDGWLDLVTATTMSDHVNDVLGQPRVYVNLGRDAGGSWRGFRFENARIPVLVSRTGAASNPRFCDAAIADYNGDGYPDIFYTDYDTPETSGQTICIDLNGDGTTTGAGECQASPAETASLDYDNRLLLNHGAANPGYFYDSGTSVMTAAQLASAFGNAAVAADMNGDGLQDIIRVNTLVTGQNVGVFTKKPGVTAFDGPKQAVAGAPYFIDTADLNGDGRLDIIVADDGQDRYLINEGNDATGQPNFTSYTIAQSLNEFGNTIQSGDLDRDGRIDTIITDVDADLGPFCPTTGRRTHIYRNVFAGSPSGILVENTPPLPTANLAAWTDVAIVDLNGDGWLDLVSGRCAGIEVWMNKPPISLTFAYPDGVPASAAPGTPREVRVQATIVGGGSVVAGSAKLFWSTDGGATYQQAPLADLGAGLFAATIPGQPCGTAVRWYVAAQLSNGGAYVDPPTAPTTGAVLTVQSSSGVTYATSFESDTTGWTVVNEGALTTGAWQVAVPIGTTQGTLGAAAPSADSTPGAGNKCWVTQNGVAGGTGTAADVDGGTTRLVSPLFDLSGSVAANLSFARWFFCSDALVGGTQSEADSLLLEGSADGGATWVRIEEATSSPSPNAWVSRNINLLAHFPVLTSQMRFRFTVGDSPDNSITEAAIDDFAIATAQCATPCTGDLNSDGVRDGADLGSLLSYWGLPGGTDINGDGTTDGADLGTLLSNWGACP